MFKQILKAASRLMAKANDNDALIPEIWSREALLTLMSNTIMASLVHRDFSAQIANEGDVVNTSRPADFSGKRKTDADNVTDQDAQSPNIPVPLDQHIHVSYVIKDGELSKALPDLLERYMEPAAREIAEKVDQVLCGQSARLLTNEVGQPGGVTELNVDQYILDADEKLNDNRAPKFGRYLVMSSRFNRAALGADIVVEADKRGDEGTALREASVGRIYGFDSFMDQNVAHVAAGSTEVVSGVTDNIEAEGSTVIESTVVDAANLVAGCYITVDGSEAHHVVSSKANDPVDWTLTAGLTAGTAAGVAVDVYAACDVDASAETGSVYAAGHVKEIILDGHDTNKNLQVGQLVSFGTGASRHTYTIVEATNTSTTSTTVLLDRPLDSSVADGANLCFPGPKGSRSLAFTRDSIALVSRPLATVANQMGARSAVTSFDGLSMRVTMQYDSQAQGTRVTFDLLCGVAILDERLACVVNG
jgi:hypothetical protein